MLSYQQFDNEPPEYQGSTERLFELYRLRTAQCLTLGDIAKCLPYTLETLLLNSSAELARKDDSGRGLWMMTGLIVRTAINMGYHRDPSRTPSISVLHSELRRRIWLAVESKDNIASFLIGFPSMTVSVYSDTLEPRNLHDWELSDETTVLPPSRPLSETTPVSYMILKERLVRILGRVSDFNNTVKPGSYEKVRELDSSLNETYESIITNIKSGNGSLSSDSNQSELSRSVSLVQITFIYHRGVCDLHRKFLSKARTNSKYSFSRDRSIASAQVMLSQQHIFHQQTRPGRQSYMPNWYQMAQARQFFTLAAMIICLDLEHRRKAISTDVTPSFEVLLDALEKSCAIWKQVQYTSDEAHRIFHILSSMISSFRNSAAIGPSHSQPPDLSFTPPESDEPTNPTNGTVETGDTENRFNDMEIDWVS
jgi:hypothetical protein